MRKHIAPKLELHRETLRNLSESDLQTAAGGISHLFCPTEEQTCTNSGCPSNWTTCC